MNDYESDTAAHTATPPNLLRQTLPGEYLSLILVAHALFGSLLWGIAAIRDPASGCLVLAGCWVGLRSAGFLPQRVFNPLVTFAILVVLFGMNQRDAMAGETMLAAFSKPVFIAMLGIILLLDVAELAISPMGKVTVGWMKSWNWHRIAIWIFVVGFLVYMVIMPTVEWIIESRQPPKTGQLEEGLSLAEQVRIRSIEAVIALWFFALGATIGSFLNVVVYRMPRGQSVVFKSSNCPRCGSKIESRDNIPILGWLRLNGRCRSCNTPISSRYPTVEFITAAVFLSLYFLELISGGANIPVRFPNIYRGVVWIIFYTKWDLVSLYLFHCYALSLLLSWSLIDVDRQRYLSENTLKEETREPKIPWLITVIVCTVLCLLPVLLPHLLPVLANRGTALSMTLAKWQAALLTSAAGGLIGAVLGWLALLATRGVIEVVNKPSTPLPEEHLVAEEHLDVEEHLKVEDCQVEDERQDCSNLGEDYEQQKNLVTQEDGDPGKQLVDTFAFRPYLISAGMIVGLAVGWQAAIGVWLLAFAMRPIALTITRWCRVNDPPMTVILSIAFFVHLLGWRMLSTEWWPSHLTSPAAWGAVAIGLVLLWLFNRGIPSVHRKNRPSFNEEAERSIDHEKTATSEPMAELSQTIEDPADEDEPNDGEKASESSEFPSSSEP